MSFRGKYYSAGNEYLDLGRSPAQFFTRGSAHLADTVGDYRHHAERTGVATGIGHLIESAKVRATAGLRQCASRVEESRPDDFPFRQQACDTVVGAARFPYRSEPVHQAAAQIIGGGSRYFGSRIGNVFWAQR